MEGDYKMPNRDFLKKADDRIPVSRRWDVLPVAQVIPVRDSSAWQGWRMKQIHPRKMLAERSFKNGDHFILDFGEELVGKLKLTLRSEQNYNDSPVRLRLIFAEFPLEITERNRKYTGTLSRAWIQDEIVTLDDMPQTYTLPRIYAMRYLFVEIIATPNRLVFEDIRFTARSAVRDFVPPLPEFSPEETELDRAAQRTLRNCMQGVLLDGPKRDRRLWLGDLRLEAQVNAATFRRFDIIERSIYLLAAFQQENGQIPACIFDRPEPYGTSSFISDYAFLFADLLWFHYEQTGNKELLKEMYSIAAKQFELFREHYRTGVAQQELPAWNFIDWCDGLDRMTACEGCYIFGLRKLAKIARLLKKYPDAKRFEQEAEFLSAELRQKKFDPKKGLFVSGKKNQISYASQIWMILAEVVTGTDARRLLEKMEHCKKIVKPVTPYLHHHLLEAYRVAGEKEKMMRHLHNYWGSMLKKGMNVFPEVFVEEKERLTPYGNDPRINSACHAWSCAPSYFLRMK